MDEECTHCEVVKELLQRLGCTRRGLWVHSTAAVLTFARTGSLKLNHSSSGALRAQRVQYCLQQTRQAAGGQPFKDTQPDLRRRKVLQAEMLGSTWQKHLA